MLFSVNERERPTDLLRIGRQPVAWDDDERTVAEGLKRGLTVEERPPIHADSETNQKVVREAMLRSKAVLAFSNLVSPAAYTHPTRDYLTGRWMDALAAGCVVAGKAPTSASYTLWPGATVEIDPHDMRSGMVQVKDLVAGWRGVDALQQHRQARRIIDWRHRLALLCDELGLQRPLTLQHEIASLGEEV